MQICFTNQAEANMMQLTGCMMDPMKIQIPFCLSSAISGSRVA